MSSTLSNKFDPTDPQLVCLECGSPLHQDGLSDLCTACGSSWPIQAGIHNFLSPGKIGSSQSRDHLNDFNRLASSEGWQAAAETIASKSGNPAHHLEYITSEARADFRFLLPSTKDDIVLDTCSGWGNMAAAFARTSKHVFAIDTSRDKLEFSKIRAEQERLDNITFIHSSPTEMPLSSESCHIALLADSLECNFWQKASTNYRHDHLQILQAIREKLVPGGCLYLGVENRYSFKYILGGGVPPSNLRFISLLPRSLANRYSRFLRQVDYQEITYSLKGITILLNQAGFTKLDILYPIPAYPKFRFLADFKSPGATDFMISRLRVHAGFNKSFYIFARLASSLGILHWFAPGFGLIAYKE